MACESQGQTQRAQEQRPTRFHLFALPLLARQRTALQQGDVPIQRGLLAFRAVDLVQLSGNDIFAVLLDQGRKGFGVQLTSRYAETSRKLLGRLKNTIRDGDGGFHSASITRVIPASSHPSEG